MYSWMGAGYYYFSFQDTIKAKSFLEHIYNDFTYEFWVNPAAEHHIDLPSLSGTDGISGKRYVIAPGHGLHPGQAGIGVSVGTNGVSIYEHTYCHLPAVLVHPSPISGWTHIAVVYSRRVPYLYINGKLVQVGGPSAIASVHASAAFGGLSPYGFFIGGLDEVRLWNVARTEQEIALSMHSQLQGDEPGLAGYWRFDDGNGIVESNQVANGDIAHVLGANWVPGRTFNKGRIGVIIHSSAYDATRHFAFDLTKALIQSDYIVEVIDLLQPTAQSKLDNLLMQQDLELIVGMNGHGIDQLRGSLYAGLLPVPFLCYLVDHPMFHVDRIPFERNLSQLIIACVDREHIRYLEKYFNNSSLKLFSPQPALNKLPTTPVKDMSERSIDLLFAGTSLSPDQQRQWWKQDLQYGAILDEIAERSMYQYDYSLLEICEQTFRIHGLPFNYTQDSRLVQLLQKVDMYIRGRRRLEIVEMLGDLPMTIFTDNPREFPNRKNIKYREPVSLKTLQAHMYDSKIVLNVLANLVYGAHERIFTAMQAGAVSLTDSNQFLDENFQDGKNILLIPYRNQNISERIGRLLEQPDQLQLIANAAAQWVPAHTWHARAQQFIGAIQAIKKEIS
ncbi:LamG-like jellyroll fold domain-containing protein [Paenibacillus terreus]|uniref:LamG-like jellyroll fold domain-containing protein n=1 Tax=Paenibacillus terreus TaxID=1387834 RepID=A0ABV5B9M2_9BACL